MTPPQTANTGNQDAGTDQNVSAEHTERRRIIEALAKADQSLLEDTWAGIALQPAYAAVRGPECGLVMIRGRIGGGGAPFNLGEATVSRATVRLQTGEVGFGQALGLVPRKAELAAVFDAMAQRPEHAGAVSALVEIIETGIAEEDAAHARRTAATRVDFFAMVRGED